MKTHRTFLLLILFAALPLWAQSNWQPSAWSESGDVSSYNEQMHPNDASVLNSGSRYQSSISEPFTDYNSTNNSSSQVRRRGGTRGGGSMDEDPNAHPDDGGTPGSPIGSPLALLLFAAAFLAYRYLAKLLRRVRG